MGDLSDHFSREEFACRHCGVVLANDSLVEALEELRAGLHRPIYIVSGYRCQEHNAAIGGTHDSRHLFGDAADISVRDIPLSRLFFAAAAVNRFHTGGIGIYPSGNFLHVDTRPARARWGRINGVIVPFLTAWEHLKAQEDGAERVA